MLSPYYNEDGITIYHGDCRDVLPSVEQTFDVVLTSPPYNVGLKYSEYVDKKDESEFREMNADWLRFACVSANEGARLYTVIGDKMIWWLRGLAEDAGWAYVQMLTWCKPNLPGSSGRITGDWNYLTEQIPLFRKGKRTSMLNGNSNTHNFFVIPSPQSNWKEERKEHVAQFPLDLPLRLLSRTPGDDVLDCFAGSGSTLCAAKILGRRAVGVELSERDCETAANRVRGVAKQQTLTFAEQEEMTFA